MTAFQLPMHDLWIADKDAELFDIYRYYLADILVFEAKVNYTDKGKGDAESVEYTWHEK